MFKFTKKELVYIEKRKKFKERERDVEWMIIQCLEDGYMQATDIVYKIIKKYPKLSEKSLYKKIYRVMDISYDLIDRNYLDDDMILL